jgi:hypothetical protein
MFVFEGRAMIDYLHPGIYIQPVMVFFLLFDLTAHNTILWSYGTETVKGIFANLDCYKLKATPGVKPTTPAGAKRCIDSNNSNPLCRL